MKKGGSTLRKELDDISYLESHPEVCQLFRDAGCYNFCKKLQSSHQQVAEAFALNFDGRKAVIGRDEFEVDEALIAEVTELPRTGEKWFKTTVTKNVEFRSYLKPERKDLIWKKDIPVSFLEEKWKQLLKAIMVYITCEGRYNRVMIYHFKLMNHFTGRNPLNLPYFLHRSLSKMAHQVKAKPNKVAGRLSHHGLIKLLVCELLQRRGKEWNYFLFWNDFQTDVQPEGKKSPHSKKSSTPRSGKRRRRAISPVPVNQPSPSSKLNKTKKKLNFSSETDKAKESPVNKSILNLPYTDSEDEEHQIETGHEDSVTTGHENSIFVDIFTASYEDLPSPTPQEEQEPQIADASSSKRVKQSKSKEIKKLKKKLAEQEVLERVIKTRYETLSKNFAESNSSLERLAHESIKEKKKKDKIVKDYNNLWRVAQGLKKKVRALRKQAMSSKHQAQTHATLETLAEVAVQCNEPEAASNPTVFEQDAEALKDHP
jgi:hypothetical protein